MLSTETTNVAERALRISETLSQKGLPGLGDTNLAVTVMSHVHQVWQLYGRIVVSMDPALMSELRHTGADQIAPAVFRQLPLISPLVIFPQPIADTNIDGYPARVLGYFIFGIHESEVDGLYATGIRPTDNPELTRLGFSLLTEVEHPTGMLFEARRITLGFDEGRTSVSELAESSGQHYRTEQLYADPQRKTDMLRASFQLVLSTALYLCTEDADIERARPVPRKKGRRQEPRRYHLVRAGWRVGPALRAAHGRAVPRDGTDYGTAVVPHQRRGHFALRWTGTGRTIPKIVWINPTWIHRDQLAPVTIRPAR